MRKQLKLAPPSSLMCIVTIAAASLVAAGAAAADPQELKVTEHNTTQVVTDVGASGDSPGDILTFGQNEVFDADDRTRSALIKASATALWRARFGSAFGRWAWRRAS